MEFFLKRQTSKCFKFPDSNKGSTIQNILMKQKKTLHQCGGNFLHSEAKVLQGDKVMFDQQILMNNDKKVWLQTTNFLLCQNLN